MTEKQTAVQSNNYAGILPRGLAYLIDCTMAYGAFVLLQVFLFSPIRDALGFTEVWFHSGLNTQLYILTTISIPIWLYFILSEKSHYQATIGKRIMKIYVTDTQSAKPMSFRQSTLRTFIKLLPWELSHLTTNIPSPLWYETNPEFRIGFVAVGLLMGLYIAMVIFHKRRQGIHDLIAQTIVKNRKK